MFNFNTVLIIGTGLIGGSLALALKKYKLVSNIIGIDINIANSKMAKKLNIIDEYIDYDNIAAAVRKANWIILAMPVGAINEVMQLISKHIMTNTIISDLGSTKQNIMQAIENFLPDNIKANFIALHPIAGSEKQGPSAANADLFAQKTIIITPNSYNTPENIKHMQELWKVLGSNSICMNAAQHDEVFSLVSHLPHVLAFAFIDYMVNLSSNKDTLHIDTDTYFSLSGSGFHDFTRIAASSPAMWLDICIANKTLILQHLSGYIDNLQQLHYIIQHHEQSLLNIFSTASKLRNQLAHKNLPN